jgi:hypothetical protein
MRAVVVHRGYGASELWRVEIIRNFDQIEIGIAKVHRKNRPGCPGALYWTVEELHTARAQVLDDLADGNARDETEVRGSGDGAIGLRIEFLADLMQVELLLPERKRLTRCLERDDFSCRARARRIYTSLRCLSR